MRRLLLVVVCFLPLGLSLASANGSSPGLRGKIVFSSDRGPDVNNSEIYSIRTDGSRPRDLSRNQGEDGDFAWSPAGNRIAFWAERTEADQLVRGLYVMRPDGSGQRRLTPSHMQVAQQSEAPTWSPDGRRLAFSAYRAGVYGIWVVRVDGHDLQLLAKNGVFPVWAPRGSRIAFLGEGGFEVVDADSGARVRVTDENVLSSPTWSPDARALAFVGWDPAANVSVLYRVAADGGLPQPLVSRQGRPWPILVDPAWSPRGTRIAFVETEDNPGSIGAIKTVDADSGGVRALGVGARPVWSPNGRQIASATYSEIDVMNADGSGRRTVRDVKPTRVTEGPAWSRDGKTLLFARTRGRADHELFVVNADGSHRRQLTRNNVEDVLPAWSPDHTRIAFARKDGPHVSIWIMSAGGKSQHRIGFGTHPAWSPEGSRLAFEHKGVVYTMTDRGRRIRRIVRGDRPSWAPRGSSIAFFRDDVLLVADVRRGTVWDPRADLTCQDRGEGTNTILSSPEWSPDAKSIVVSVTCDYGVSTEISVVIVDLRGSFSEVPIDLAPESRLAWSPDGRRLAFSLGNEGYGDVPKIVTTRLDGSSRTTVSSGAGDDRDPDW